MLGSLSDSEVQDYACLRTRLEKRFDPKYKVSLYKCEFRNRSRKKGESVSDFGYCLEFLERKAHRDRPREAKRQL